MAASLSGCLYELEQTGGTDTLRLGLAHGRLDAATCQWTLRVTSATLVMPLAKYRFLLSTDSKVKTLTLDTDLTHVGAGADTRPQNLQPGDRLVIEGVTEAGSHTFEATHIPTGAVAGSLERQMAACGG